MKWHPLRLLAVLGIALLAGCGPGVGGTGTGETVEGALQAYGATPAALCTSALAAALPCTGANGVGVPGTSDSTVQPLWLADASGSGQGKARVLGNDVSFEASCTGVNFSGRWGSVPNQFERFYGLARKAPSAEPQLATLTLVPVAGGLQLLVEDDQGRVLAGPLVMKVQNTEPAAGRCPVAH